MIFKQSQIKYKYDCQSFIFFISQHLQMRSPESHFWRPQSILGGRYKQSKLKNQKKLEMREFLWRKLQNTGHFFPPPPACSVEERRGAPVGPLHNLFWNLICVTQSDPRLKGSSQVQRGCQAGYADGRVGQSNCVRNSLLSQGLWRQRMWIGCQQARIKTRNLS